MLTDICIPGDDFEGKYDEALVHKGAVDIQMGQGANLEIRGLYIATSPLDILCAMCSMEQHAC